MKEAPYIFLGDKQEAGTSDLATAIRELIEQLAYTPSDYEEIEAILEDNHVSYE